MTPIKEFPGYFVTRTGEVWSERKRGYDTGTAPLHQLKPIKHRQEKGRLQVSLYKDGKLFTRGIHRLLAETLIPNPLGLPLVRHLDDDVANNLWTNLAWGTHRDNIMDRHQNQIPIGRQKLMPLNVLWIRERRRQGVKLKDLAALHRVTPGNVRAICNRISWKHLP